MYQRLDFFDWEREQAEKVRLLLENTTLLEDFEIITEVDGITSGFFEVSNINIDEVEYLGEHWEYIINVSYDERNNLLRVEEMSLELY